MKIEKIIQEKYHELNQNEIYIWNYILHHKEDCENISIQDLAVLCNVSHASILRFVRKLGFQGYSEFKYYLRWEKGEERFGRNELEICCQEVMKNVELIRERDCSDIFQLIESNGRIFLYGTGETQVNAAKELKRCFSVVNKYLHLIEGFDEIMLIAEQADETDVFIIFSVSGENTLILKLLDKLEEKKIKVIAFTFRQRNTLGEKSTIHIPLYTHRVQTRQSNYDINMVSHFSTVAELLFLKYLEYLG